MGKPKKGKKGRQDDDFGDDDVEIDPLAAATEAEPASEPAKAAGKKGKKGRRKKDDDWEDDIANEISALALDGEAPSGSVANGEDSQPQGKKKDKRKNKKKVAFDESGSEDEDDEAPSPTPIPKPKTKKGGVSAFQMLAIEDEDDDEEEDEKQSSDEAPTPAPTPVVEAPQPAAAKGKKGKQKGKQKGKSAEDEDIDALLAAIDAPEEKKGKKKKKKGGEEEPPSEEPTPAATPMEEEAPAMDVGNMTQEQIAAMLEAQYDEEEADRKKKKKKGKKEAEAAEPAAAKEPGEEGEEGEGEGEEEGETTVKTAAQKKKEKKERQRLQKLAEKEKAKKKGGAPAETAAAPTTAAPPAEEAAEGTPPPGAEPAAEGGSDAEVEESDKKKKKKDKKKKKKGEEEEEKEKKKKPVNKQVRAMQEALAKMKEEEERLQREEEERQKAIEAARLAKEEKERLEKEKKEKDKQKKKEKMERLKAEGKYMTAKQKEAKRRAEQMLEAMKAQGIALPQVEETDKPKKRVVYDNKKKKKPQGDQLKSPTTPTSPGVEDTTVPLPQPEETKKEEAKPEEKEKEVVDSWDDIKDEWDASSDEEEKETEAPQKEPETKAPAQVEVKVEDKMEEKEEEEEEESEDEEDDDEESDEESDEDSEDDSSSEEEEKLTPAEKMERVKEKARQRMQKAHETAEAKRTTDKLRAPVVVVLGHVDTGKTKILDKLRRTNVQDGEAGGITQQIGATNVPEHTIREQTKMCKEFTKKELRIPGLLIIDTPGHESFSNLRNRGSSLCDIAILVIDIMHGLEPQTIESIGLLKKRKTPFVVALNKIDRLFGWLTNPHADIQNTIKKQKPNTKIEFDERVQQVIVQLAEQGLNACLFYDNKNPREYISLVPTSAISGDGMGSMIALICELTQTMLAKRLMWSEELQAITMEVKAIAGLGTTIDVILVNGSIKEGQTVVMGGTDGPIVTQIRGLLMPQPLKELRVKNAYTHHKEVIAAQGVKIIAKDLEKGLAGLPMYVAHGLDEVEVYKEEVENALGDILDSIKVQERGVFVQASTLGSLEALLEFLRTSKIPYAGINIGPVHRRDIMKASIMLEHDIQYAVILAFDVKVERDAQEMADNLGVRIFTADIIYHLFDQFMAHRAEYKKQKQEEFKNIAVFPCKLRILPQYVFNSRDPIVAGVVIEAGFVKEGMPLCVPSKQFVEIGRVTSIEVNHKQVESAKKGQEVCIKIEPIPGEAPKLFGRHFDETDIVTSKITRQSIDAVKDHFREEMTKADWQLMVELKKIFQIL